ncbi:MAG: hypothetical protein JSV03_04230 [Planctomycetota bacterium]|nr:MAG: hypothetical protein JSV03_04230 [Planctomycetota bacterium]
MALALKSIKAYLKLGAIILLLVIALLIVFMNRNHKADIWFFRRYQQVNVLWLILVTAVISVIGWWMVRKIVSVVREVKQIRRSSKAEAKLDEQQRLAEKLLEREKRIDEKVRRSITEE